MNEIAIDAKRALTAPGFPSKNGLCQMFARLVVQSTSVGHQFDEWFWKQTAKEAAESLLKTPYGTRRTKATIPQPGDLLYKTTGSGGAGHVGIVIDGGLVAENSTVHWNETNGKDARGTRTLAQFGNYDVLVRFPVAEVEAKPETSVVVSVWDGEKWFDKRFESFDKANTNFLPAQELLRWSGADFTLSKWGDGTPNIRIITKPTVETK